MSRPAPRAARGRRGAPLEVRLQGQRDRLLAAAATVFARVGYAEATAEAISREAGMSKATFYEHFANKEECILALFDAAAERSRRAVASGTELGDTPEEKVRRGVRAFLSSLVEHPDHARTLLVEILGAGPRASARRDEALERFAEMLDEQSATAAVDQGHPRFRTREDTFALVGAVVELAARQLRTGRPADPLQLEPVIERLIAGVLRVSG